jgi:hypothetical protein
MRDIFLRATLVGVALASWSTPSSTWGQMHKVAKPEQVVRAIGVFEWTGDLTKPTASRLIPVSIFIEGKLEDAGVYVARPVPFALLSGNVYELQDAGIDKGFLDLVYARHLQAVDATGDLAYDDGWFGYGSVKPLTASVKKPAKLKPSKTLPVLTSSTGATTSSSRPQLTNKTSGDSTPAGSGDQSKTTSNTTSGTATTSDSSNDPDRPTMKRRSSGTADDTTGNTTTSSGSTTTSTASTQGTGSTPADDPDRPTMKRRSDSSSGSSSSGTADGTTTTTASSAGTANAPADDPDRPTMKRRSTDSTDSAGNTADSTASTGSGSTPANDPDRPTLKRHSAEDAKKARNNDLASVSGTGSLNDDPDRPNLHHGKPTSAMTETELPKLVGLPPDLHQMVAVSDAANRDPHEFTLSFDDATQRATVLQKLQGMAQAQLAAYKGSSTPASAATVKKLTATTTSKSRRATPPPPVPLLDEELKAYTLSYGGAATYVYTAHTAGTGAALRYVTIVAQADGLGELKPAIQNVTDAAHLDRTPRMRFVDVVDAEASNRASLLFELRGQNSRQFGLYRVIAAHSEQIFLTGTTQ